MKFKNYYLVAATLITLFSCSSDNGDNPNPPNSEPTESIVIELTGVRDIFPTWAKFQGKKTQNQNNNRLVGFVYSTNPNPIVDNSNTFTVSAFRTGTNQFEFLPLNCVTNTTYFIKAFVQIGNTYSYSAEQTFRTTGYFGPAGGYVAFDIGVFSDGWRYMEMHPVTLNFNSAGVGAKWGDTGTFISGTVPDFGKGLENTIIIANNTVTTNCAAELCLNLNLNGYSDWFLPSIQEVFQMTKELRNGGINFPYESWSSTQVNADFANATFYNLGQLGSVPIFQISQGAKGTQDDVYPVRRY